MPRTFEKLVDHGVTYSNFFTPVSLCCPSRVSLLRIQAAHNHNITFVDAPWGGWEIFNQYGYVGHTLPDFLQQAGYNTYYVGKFMNSHTAENCVSMPVSGFNGSDFLVDPYTYDYWTPGFSHNNGPVEIHNGTYSTDIVAEKSLGHLDEALADDRPFFVGIAPIGPHSRMSSWEGDTHSADHQTWLRASAPALRSCTWTSPSGRSATPTCSPTPNLNVP